MPDDKPRRYIGADVAGPGVKPGDVVRIGGLDVTVVSPADAEKASCVVCIGITIPLTFPDNLTGPCADCGDTVQWRPHAPKKPAKICMDCATIRSLKEATHG